MAKSLYWKTDFIGGLSGDLDSINAETESLEVGCAAVVINTGDAYFYTLKQAASPPAESSPTIIHPDVNLSVGDPVYWEQIQLDTDYPTPRKITTTVADVVTTNVASDVSSLDGNLVTQESDFTTPTDETITHDFNSGDKADYLFEDSAKIDFDHTLWPGKAVIGSESVLIGTGVQVGDELTNPASGHYYRMTARSPSYYWDILGATLRCFNATADPITLLGSTTLGFTPTVGSGRTLIAAYDKYVFIGDINYAVDKTGGGRVAVYEINGTTVSYTGNIVNPAPARNDYFGSSVEINEAGTHLVVGQSGGDEVRFFKGTAPTTFTHNLTVDGGAVNFAIDVYCYGNKAWVGDPTNQQIRYWTESGGTWTEGTAISYAATGFGYRLFGWKDKALVVNSSGLSYGLVYIDTGSGMTRVTGVTIATQAYTTGVWMNGTKVITGDWTSDIGHTNAGKIIAYDMDTTLGTCTYDTTVYPGDSYTDARVGIYMLPHGKDEASSIAWCSCALSPFKIRKISEGDIYEDQFIEGDWYFTTSDTNQIDISGYNNLDSAVTVVLAQEYTGCTVQFLLSLDDRVSWLKWNGSSWATHSGGLADIENGNTPAEFNTGLDDLVVAGYSTLDYAINLHRDATATEGVTPYVEQAVFKFTPLPGMRYVDLDKDVYEGYYAATGRTLERIALSGRTEVNTCIIDPTVVKG